MPRGTTPAPVQSGQVMPSWATIALRMNALLLGSLLRNSARSSSTLNATIWDFGDLRDGMNGPRGVAERMSLPVYLLRIRGTRDARLRSKWHRGAGPTAGSPDYFEFRNCY